jgi:hypothetical protein
MGEMLSVGGGHRFGMAVSVLSVAAQHARHRLPQLGGFRLDPDFNYGVCGTTVLVEPWFKSSDGVAAHVDVNRHGFDAASL